MKTSPDFSQSQLHCIIKHGPLGQVLLLVCSRQKIYFAAFATQDATKTSRKIKHDWPSSKAVSASNQAEGNPEAKNDSRTQGFIKRLR